MRKTVTVYLPDTTLTYTTDKHPSEGHSKVRDIEIISCGVRITTTHEIYVYNFPFIFHEFIV